jgi:hypothetical protein
MSRLCRGTALAALLATSPALAQDKTAEAPGPGPRPAEVVAYLHDGTVLRKVLLREGVAVVTRFGRLTVPAAEIRRIEFGLHLPEEVAREVEAAVKQLGSDEYKQREAAGKRLVALGYRAYPAVQAAARSPDKEVAARARAAAEQIRKAAPAELLSLREHDVVHTRDCVLAGRIEAEALKAQTTALGPLSLRLGELRALRSGAVDRTEVAVEAAQFAAPGKWVDSGVAVEAGGGLVVAAGGRVDLVPAQAGQHVSGPGGYQAQGGDPGFAAGALLGRVGEDGQVFVVGQRYEGRSTRGGKLYLRIVPLAGGAAPSGTYQVKVNSGPGVEVQANAAAPPQPAGYGPASSSVAPAVYTVPAGVPLPAPAVPRP